MSLTFLRRLLAWSMVTVVVVSLAAWYLTRETLPAKLRIASAEPGGLYYQVGLALEQRLEKRSRLEVEVIVTRGSVENRQLLKAGKADLALLQAGAVDLEGLVALAPVYQDLVHVIARRESGISTLADLNGRRVAVGPDGSGMRENAKAILAHYRAVPRPAEPGQNYFMDLLADQEIDAAIVTTGLLNPDLGKILATGHFTLIPVLDAEALSIRHRYYSPSTLPRGFYFEGPPIPPADIPTVATTTFLAARDDVSDLIVRTTLEAFYEDDLRSTIPTVMPRQKAALWQDLPTHKASQSFFQPYSGLGILANFMESLAALKELVFAFGAGLYLLWVQWRRGKQRATIQALQADKERLDVFLERTIEIEREQIAVEDPEQLRGYLRRVTATKLQALEELSHEELRGDVNFTIFLQQCADLARKIQGKIEIYDRRHSRARPLTLAEPESSRVTEP